jgi:hypothetical protein
MAALNVDGFQKPPNQVLEVANIGRQVGLVRVNKPIAYLDIDDTGLVEAGYWPQA